tara:strand:+ start:52 stop:519 length:468 start_codon:yes stop_codon:yes gene_type:complete
MAHAQSKLKGNSCFEITDKHLKFINEQFEIQTVAFSDTQYTETMEDLLRGEKCYSHSKRGERCRLVLKNGLIYEKNTDKLVIPMRYISSTHVKKIVPSTFTGLYISILNELCPNIKQRDWLISKHMHEQVAANHTGNHYRNHTLRIKAPLGTTSF